MARNRISIRIVAILAISFLAIGAVALHVLGQSSHPSPIPLRLEPPYQPGLYSFSLERTACFGPCPVFALTIKGDGSAALRVGDNPTAMPGQVDADAVLRLVETAEQGDFRRLKRDYSIQATDLPSTIISIESPLGIHQVSVYGVVCISHAKQDRVLGRYRDSTGSYVPDVFCSLEEQLDRTACTIYQANTAPAERVRRRDDFWNPAPDCETYDE